MNRICFVLSLIVPVILLAQENLPLLPDVRYEILTDSLEKNSKAQMLRLQINCTSSQAGQKYSLELKALSGLPVLVDASRDGTALWLIQSPIANSNNSVLSWQMLDGGVIQFSPGTWNTPFRLDLTLQISPENIKDLQNLTDSQIGLKVLRNNTVYLATPSGRGNKIFLK
jgi:hypothetical protein